MFAKDKIIERIVRVNQAGEIGAQRIYNGQKFVFKLFNNKKEYEIFSEMAQEEKEHLDYFNKLAKEKNIKPSKLAPLFDIGAFAMGVSTALIGPKAAYVCTEAVEEIIEQHYSKQIDQLDIILAVIKIRKLIPINPLESVTILKGTGVNPPINTYIKPNSET